MISATKARMNKMIQRMLSIYRINRTFQIQNLEFKKIGFLILDSRAESMQL